MYWIGLVFGYTKPPKCYWTWIRKGLFTHVRNKILYLLKCEKSYVYIKSGHFCVRSVAGRISVVCKYGRYHNMPCMRPLLPWEPFGTMTAVALWVRERGCLHCRLWHVPSCLTSLVTLLVCGELEWSFKTEGL